MLSWEKKEVLERGRGALVEVIKGEDGWGQLCSDTGRRCKPIVIRG